MAKNSNELKYKHFFKVKNGKIIWEKPDLLKEKISMLEGKEGYAIITELEEEITRNQYAYYFGAIIKAECMNSEAFIGMTAKEIHQHLFQELKSYVRGVTIKRKGKEPIETFKPFVEDFNSYGRKKMAQYIDELIPHLLNNYGIEVKDSVYYKYNKFNKEKK